MECRSWRCTVPLLFLALIACSSPQISPHYYYNRVVDKETGSVRYEPDFNLPAHRPASLEGVVVEVEKLRMQFRVESVALGGTSTGLSNFLVGLTTFGLYKGVTHPTVKTVAGAGALGSAAFAYGNTNKFGDRASAFNDGYERLSCSLGAAAPYRIRLGATGGEIKDVDGLFSLISQSQMDLASLQNSWLELEPYGSPILKKPAKAGGSNCAAWTGNRWRSAYEKACHSKGVAEEVEPPPASVEAALKRAEALEKILRKDLADAGRMLHASNAMADRLWYNATKIENGVNTTIGATISSPQNALEAAKNSYKQNANLLQASQAAEAAEMKSQKAQSTKATPPKTRRLEEGERARIDRALTELQFSMEAAQAKSNSLRSILAINNVPSLSFAEIDRCRSSADEVVQSIADSVVASAKKPQGISEPNIRTPLADASIDFFLGLGFSSKPVDMLSAAARVEKCQQTLGRQIDSSRWEEINSDVVGGKCKGVKWG